MGEVYGRRTVYTRHECRCPRPAPPLVIVLDVPDPHKAFYFPFEHLKCVYCAYGVRSFTKKEKYIVFVFEKNLKQVLTILFFLIFYMVSFQSVNEACVSREL